MRFGWVLMALVAGPALADAELPATGCHVAPNGAHTFLLIECQVTNTTSEPVGTLAYSYRATEEGRSLPWLESPTWNGPQRATVPGGIEPGETVPVLFSADLLPERADPVRVEWAFTVAAPAP